MNKIEKKLKLNILWHMHQPYYKDDESKNTTMPWVFLHAIKDYYDIPWYMKNFSSIKATFNLVPSLLHQIDGYINGDANDILLESLKKVSSELNPNDFDILNSYLFISNEKNMIKPLRRYNELFLKYKIEKSINNFSVYEICDAQVLFLLAWCGNYLRTNNEIVKTLLKKEQNYTHNEKIELIGTLINFLPTITEYYKSLESDGKITLSTTPFYHPIAPLLLDIKSAKDAKESADIPTIKNSFSNYADLNTTMAIEYFEKKFGKKPKGFWPAEGSVSQKTAELFAKNGVKWFCSDEEILFKTLHDTDKKNIYKNYKLNLTTHTIDIRFRDHYLSDAIGFEYSTYEPKKAAKEFVANLKKICDGCDFTPLVNVILDGENAWEFFEN
ncbi:MAG: glycoside hydrolase, partial [Campylobacterales bacterium]|nr:glycoside hydrolase [Campylobacterales bacterium]